MTAVLVQDPYTARLVTKHHKVFAQNRGRHGKVRELFTETHRMPEPTHVFAHGCAVANARQLVVGFGNFPLVIAPIGTLILILVRSALLYRHIRSDIEDKAVRLNDCFLIENNIVCMDNPGNGHAASDV